MRDEHTLLFSLKYSFHANEIKEVFGIRKSGKRLIISDLGITMKNLDRIFHLESADVQKSLKAAMKSYGIRQKSGSHVLMREVKPTDDIVPQILRFLYGIHFLYTLKLFYA